jgi:hypothetical protein
VVLLANAVARAWPRERPLDFVHLPIVDSMARYYYEPLAMLALPRETRVIAGLVYEDGRAANEARFELAADALGHPPDVACSRGLGRRAPFVARLLLDESKALASVHS